MRILALAAATLQASMTIAFGGIVDGHNNKLYSDARIIEIAPDADGNTFFSASNDANTVTFYLSSSSPGHKNQLATLLSAQAHGSKVSLTVVDLGSSTSTHPCIYYGQPHCARYKVQTLWLASQ